MANFNILSIWSTKTKNETDLMNKDYLGQQGKKVQEVGWRKKKTENKVFSKKMTFRPVIIYENCFFLIDVKCQLLFFSFCLALVDRDEQRGQNI